MNKPVIQKIKFTKEEQEEIDLINQGKTMPSVRTVISNGVKHDIITHKRFTFEMGHKRLAQLYGGVCRCGSWPSYKVLHDKGDQNQNAWLVERFCQNCYDKQGIKK